MKNEKGLSGFLQILA